MLRSFIAIRLPPEIQEKIVKAAALLRTSIPRGAVRWVEGHNLHLTLKFLGDVAPARLDQLAIDVAAEVANLEPFEIEIQGSGAFPSNAKARILWVGVIAPPALQKLQQRVEVVVERLGFPPEERAFSPHLTIGRTSQHISPQDLAAIRRSLENTSIGALGRSWVKAVHIFKSDLKPGGAVYTPLYAARLEPKQEVTPEDH